jgi:hypothetical protein
MRLLTVGLERKGEPLVSNTGWSLMPTTYSINLEMTLDTAYIHTLSYSFRYHVHIRHFSQGEPSHPEAWAWGQSWPILRQYRVNPLWGNWDLCLIFPNAFKIAPRRLPSHGSPHQARAKGYGKHVDPGIDKYKNPYSHLIVFPVYNSPLQNGCLW